MRWDVENIREVYYQGFGVTGHESYTQCPTQTSSFNLRVIFMDGSAHDYWVTINRKSCRRSSSSTR